jgi:hypothetical protein
MEADDAGLSRYLERSEGTSALLDRLHRHLARATDPDRRKGLAIAIEYTKSEAA